MSERNKINEYNNKFKEDAEKEQEQLKEAWKNKE